MSVFHPRDRFGGPQLHPVEYVTRQLQGRITESPSCTASIPAHLAVI